MILEYVEIMPFLLFAEEILHVLVVDLEVAEVEFVTAFEKGFEEVFVG